MRDAFEARFGSAPERVWRAPGRVNLIGEHTDYNLGFVLPIALDLACYIAAAPAPDGRLRVYSELHRDERSWAVGDIRGLKPERSWTDYIVGVAQELSRAGYGIEPQNLLVRSTVPEGSGLSSSAALEVSCALALLRGRTLDTLELARLCQRAESRFVGMPCGIMDQYVAVFGQSGSAIRIDCRSLEFHPVKLPARVEFIAVNSMVKHELASSAYRQRTEECATAVEMIRARHPSVESLRDVTPADFLAIAETLPPVIARRARHVILENDRVVRFVEASAAGDLRRMGELFVDSHRSLQHDYEVSSPELDFLVDTALATDGVYGARMTGGGFGGCIVAMLRPDAATRFREAVTQQYRERFSADPAIYPCHPSGGAAEIKKFEKIPPSQD